jgi:hypothetical protein
MLSLGVGCGSGATDSDADAGSGRRSFQINPECKLSGPLDVAIGQGEGGLIFRPLAAGEEPVLFRGPQGGTHLALAVSVKNAAEQYPGLQINFTASAIEADGTKTKLGMLISPMRPDDPRLQRAEDGRCWSGVCSWSSILGRPTACATEGVIDLDLAPDQQQQQQQLREWDDIDTNQMNFDVPFDQAFFGIGGRFDSTSPPGFPAFQPGPFPGLWATDYAYKTVLGWSDAQIADRRADAVTFLKQRFGLDPDDASLTGKVFFSLFFADPRWNYRAYQLPDMDVPAEGYQIYDGGFAMIVTSTTGLVFGGQFAGTPAPPGTLLTFGSDRM